MKKTTLLLPGLAWCWPTFGLLLIMELLGTASAFGAYWKQTTAPNLNWSSVAASSDGSRLIAVAPGFPSGFIFRSTNYGDTWTQVNGPAGKWTSVASSTDGLQLVVVGNDFPTGPVYVSADGGVTWTQSPAPSNPWTSVACSADGTMLVIVSDLFPGGPVFTSRDAGGSWTISPAPMASWKAVASSADGNRLIIAADNFPDGPVYTSADAGASWTPVSVTPAAWTSAAASADGSKFFLAANNPQDGSVITLDDAGSGFQAVPPPDNYTAVACSADGQRVLTASSLTNGVGGILRRYGPYAVPFGDLEWADIPTPIRTWSSVASSADGSNLVAAARGGGIFRWEQEVLQPPPSYAFSIGPFTGTNRFVPNDIVVDSNDILYVADGSSPRILKFSRSGSLLLTWEAQGMGVALAVDRNNAVYMADPGNQRITKFNTNGTVLAQWDGFWGPQGVAVDASGIVYVADVAYSLLNTHLIILKKVSATGAILAEWPLVAPYPDFGPAPARVAVDGAGNVLVSESDRWILPWANRVEKFSSLGLPSLRWGIEGEAPGQFKVPRGLATDGNGHVYVADSGNHRIQRFSAEAGLECTWGTNGLANGEFFTPSGVAVDRTGNFVYVADTDNWRVQVFAYSNAGPPVIVRQPVTQLLVPGANVTFSVAAFGAPTFSYQWRFRGTNLPGATQPVLTIPSASLMNTGAYSVVVANGLGSLLSSTAFLLHTTVPPFANTQPAWVLSPTSAQLRGMATPRSANTAGWFEWGTNTNYGQRVGITNLPGGFDVVTMASTLTGLSREPVYHYRLVTSNAFGIAHGVDRQFALGRRIVAWRYGIPDPLPAEMASVSNEIVAITTGSYHLVGLKNDGRLALGRLGDFPPPDESFASLSNLVAVATGVGEILALRTDGTVVASVNSTLVPPGLSKVVALSSSSHHHLALRSDGTVVGWPPGSGFNHTLHIPADLKNVVAIAAGDGFSLALRDNGTIASWGDHAPPMSDVVTNIMDLTHEGRALQRDGTVVSLFEPFTTNALSGLSNVVAISDAVLLRDGTLAQDPWRPEYSQPPAGLSGVVAIAGRGLMALSDVVRILPIASADASEGDTGMTNVTVTLRLDRSQTGTVSVDYATADGSAGAGDDYVVTRGTLVFAPGETIKTITVPIFGELLDETNENFSIILANPTNVMLSMTSVPVVIVDDDDVTVITNQPRNQITLVGEDAIFSVGVSGSPPFTYQWRLNETDLPGETNATLRLPSVRSSDHGKRFDVVVTGKLTTATSQQALLTVTVNTTNAGAVDLTFNPGAGANGPISALLVQPDQRILIGGNFTSFDGVPRGRIARLLPDGALDPSFTDPATDGPVAVLLQQPDGRILIGGAFTNVQGSPYAGVARLNVDGSLDGSFLSVTGFTVRAMALQSDGRVVLSGTYTFPNGNTSYRLVRLNSNGDLDPAFRISDFNSPPTTVAIRGDGKILAGNEFRASDTRDGLFLFEANGFLDFTFGGSSLGVLLIVPYLNGQFMISGRGAGSPPRHSLARLWPDGTQDSSMLPGTDVYSDPVAPNVFPSIHFMVTQTDGKLVIGGRFGAVNGAAQPGLARIFADGSVDPAFNPGFGPNDTILAAAAVSHGRILIAGQFTAVDGVPRSRIARLLGDDGPPRIGSPPADATGTVGFPVTLSATTTNGRPPLSYQWHRNGLTPVPFGTNEMLVLAAVQSADAGSYRLVVSNVFGAVTSSPAALTVLTGPRLVSAGSVDGFSVGLRFSVPITTNSARNLLNYSVVGGGRITNATLRADGRTVVLDLESRIADTFTVNASGLVDAGPGFVGGGSVTGQITGISAAFLGTPGLYPNAAHSFAAGEIEVLAGGGDTWGSSDNAYFVSAPHTGDFDLRVRAHHLLPTHTSAKAGLMVRESLNPASRTLWLATMPAPPYRSVCEPGIRSNTSSDTRDWGIPEVTFVPGNTRASPPNTWLRMKRVGSLFQGYTSADGNQWRIFAQANQTFSNSVNLGLVVAGIRPDLADVALFRDYGGPLAGGLDAPALTWTTAGSDPWFTQRAVTHDGLDALQSGAITHGQSSSVETVLIGPGTLRFWWKVSSEAGADRLALSLNGMEHSSVSGETDWQQRTVAIPTGFNTLTWTYAKDSSGSAGGDAAWLDQVEFAAVPMPPLILTQPSDLAVLSDSNALFSVVATNGGNLPISYQWFFNQTTPVGLPLPSLLITNANDSHVGSYFAVISNAVGSVTSRVATLQIAYPPVIVMATPHLTNIAGDDVTFSVTVTNNAILPINYSLRKSISIPFTNIVLNSRTCSFTLFNISTNVTTTNGPGDYRLLATNAGGPLIGGLITRYTARILLTVLPADAPTAAITLSASSLTPNGATLNATVNPMGAVTTGWFDYGLTAAYGSRTAAARIGNATSPVAFAQPATGLLPGTNYHYRVVATNHGGLVMGQDRTFQTPPLSRPIISGYTRLASGQVRLQFNAQAGSVYTVLVSTNLLAWTSLGSASETVPGQFEFTDAAAPVHPTRFYQLRSP